jgi:hypothetical protein
MPPLPRQTIIMSMSTNADNTLNIVALVIGGVLCVVLLAVSFSMLVSLLYLALDTAKMLLPLAGQLLYALLVGVCHTFGAAAKLALGVHYFLRWAHHDVRRMLELAY